MSTTTAVQSGARVCVDNPLTRLFYRCVSPCHRPAVIVVTVLAVWGGGLQIARAEAGETVLSTGVELLMLNHALPDGAVSRLAPLIELSFRHAVDDFWELGGTLAMGFGLGGGQEAEAVGRAAFESRFVIDALTWVPFLSFGLGVLFRGDGPRGWDGGPRPALDITGHLGGGLEWRPARAWSVGVGIRYHAVLTDLGDTVGPIELGATVSWYLD